MKKKSTRLVSLSLSALMAVSALPTMGLQQIVLATPNTSAYTDIQTQPWTAGKLYQQGAIVSYKGSLYKCRQGHTSLTGWEPPVVPALWLLTESIPGPSPIDPTIPPETTAPPEITAPTEKPDIPEIIQVSSISLSQVSASLSAGEKLTLKATISPANAADKSVTWSSSNYAVASVKKGIVTAKAPGTAAITAKAGAKTAVCLITVRESAPQIPDIVEVSSVHISPASIHLTVEESAALHITVLPSNATDKTITYTSSNERIAVVKGNTVTAMSEGTAVITVTSGTKKSICTVKVTPKETVKPSPEDGSTEHTEPPVPFWKNYKSYPKQGTEVYYKGNIYKNKWYANSGFEPGKGDPWTLVGPAKWTVAEDPKNYEKDTSAASNAINKVLNDSEIQMLYGGINPAFSPEAALHRLDQLIPESAYNELFPYRFGSPLWKAAPSTKNYYPNPDTLPDYYSYQNLKKAVSNLSNTIIKVQWYEGASWCYRLIRLDKTTKEQKLIYSDPNFDAEWIQCKPLCTSVCDYGSFLAEGDLNTRKRELAGFLANISHETGGGTVDGLTDDSKSGLYFNEEVGFIGSTAIGYVQPTGTSYLPTAGKSYHGRGPIQLSYNYNYGLCSDVLFGNSSKLLNNPDLVEQDGVLGFMTGIWFWMTPQPPKPSCHQVITGTWKPKADAPNAEFNGNFGLTIIIINNEAGQSEHGAGAVARRAKYFRIFSEKMGADITGEHCDTVGMGTFTQTSG